MTKVLVTGAGGFIGSTLCEKLLEKGYEVNALCRYSSDNSIGWLKQIKKLEKLNIFFGDIVDPNIAKEAIPKDGYVINMAALIGIPYSYLAPASYVNTNIYGALNYLTESLKKNIKGFIQTSTSETYGTAQYVPIDEAHPLVGQSPYAATKIGADQLALSYYKSFDLPVVVLRPFNTYGPRQSNRAFIPTVISQILSEESDLINVGNLDSFRDFNFVEDTANAFVAILENFENCKGEVFNSCSNFQISMKQVVEILKDISSTTKVLNIQEERIRPEKSEVDRLWGDNSKIIKATNWCPKYTGISGFEKGLEKTYKWFKNNGFDYNNVTRYIV
tara:strand:+ start:541 stop:1536 length:996 start_codon:yes stop_codon:yes gene_type:complete